MYRVESHDGTLAHNGGGNCVSHERGKLRVTLSIYRVDSYDGTLARDGIDTPTIDHLVIGKFVTGPPSYRLQFVSVSR